MNEQKINKLKEKESEFLAKNILHEKELQNKRCREEQKNVHRKEKSYTNFILLDLSGGLLGI